jgi:RimJ/RimL family protein N-acetyltransferase
MPQFAPIVLETPRLRLRWLTEADAEAQFALYSDPVAMRYWSSGAWTKLEQAHAQIEQARAAYAGGTMLRLAMELKESGEVIGNSTLYDFYDQNRRCGIGYVLASAHQGQGLMNEALRATVIHAFEALDINRIEADIDPRNRASARTLERLGFRKEGHMPERWLVNGEVCDTDYYGLLRRYWNERIN